LRGWCSEYEKTEKYNLGHLADLSALPISHYTAAGIFNQVEQIIFNHYRSIVADNPNFLGRLLKKFSLRPGFKLVVIVEAIEHEGSVFS